MEADAIQTAIDSLKGEITKVSGNVRDFATEMNARFARGDTWNAEMQTKFDKLLSEANADREGLMKELSTKITEQRDLIRTQGEQISDLEQKTARFGTGLFGSDDPDAHLTPGQRAIKSESFQHAMNTKGWKGRARSEMAAITTVTAGATRDVLVPYQRIPGIVERPNRRMTIRDLLTPGRTGQNAVQYVREVGFDNGAAMQSEGATKGQSDIDYELKTVPVQTVAHFIVASKQILDDAPQLESSIDGRLRYGLMFVEEAQLLTGSGTGTDLNGLITQAVNFSRTFLPDLPNRIDDVRLAILQTELAEFPATGVVLHPTDWARIETAKDTQGKYLLSSVTDGQGVATTRLWSLPVVSTQSITATKFLVGAFSLGAQIFDREDAAVELSTEDNDNFRRNLVTLRAEERLALAVYRPESFIYGTFTTNT